MEYAFYTETPHKKNRCERIQNISNNVSTEGYSNAQTLMEWNYVDYRKGKFLKENWNHHFDIFHVKWSSQRTWIVNLTMGNN